MCNYEIVTVKMDELCDMFDNQKITCSDENTDELREAFKKTQKLMRSSSLDHVRWEEHLSTCYIRYAEYLQKLRFRGSFRYIGNMISEFMNDSTRTPKDLFLATYFIDSELLFAIGGITIGDVEDTLDEG